MLIGCDMRVFGVIVFFLVDPSIQHIAISNVLPNSTVIYSRCMFHEVKNVQNETFNPNELIINHCFIPEVPNAYFARVPNLLLLEITESKVNNLQDFAFNGLVNLQSLNLMKNNISAIKPWSIEHMQNLTNLDLHRNVIASIAAINFSHFPKLQKLNLAVNLISGLPHDVFKLVPYLKYLNIGRNALSSISAFAFRGLTKLSHLALHHNHIERIDNDAFVTNGNLRTLRLEGNRLTKIDPVLIQTIPRLTHFNLSHNSLEGFADELFNMSAELKSLDLSFNRFENITENMFNGLEVLEVLNFSSNSIKNIHPSSFTNLNNMVHFDMSANNVTSLTADIFKCFRHVKYLNLSENSLDEIDSNVFQQMEALQILDLSANRLHTDNFLQLKCRYIMYLDLSYNLFRGLNLSCAYHMGRVNLIGNPWDCEWLIAEITPAPDTIHFGHNYIIASKSHFLNVSGIDCYDDLTHRSIILMENKNCDETRITTQITPVPKILPWPTLRIAGDSYDNKSVILWLVVAVALVFMAVQGGKTVLKKSEKKSEQLRQLNHERVIKQLDSYFDRPQSKASH